MSNAVLKGVYGPPTVAVGEELLIDVLVTAADYVPDAGHVQYMAHQTKLNARHEPELAIPLGAKVLVTLWMPLSAFEVYEPRTTFFVWDGEWNNVMFLARCIEGAADLETCTVQIMIVGSDEAPHVEHFDIHVSDGLRSRRRRLRPDPGPALYTATFSARDAVPRLVAGPQQHPPMPAQSSRMSPQFGSRLRFTASTRDDASISSQGAARGKLDEPRSSTQQLDYASCASGSWVGPGVWDTEAETLETEWQAAEDESSDDMQVYGTDSDPENTEDEDAGEPEAKAAKTSDFGGGGGGGGGGDGGSLNKVFEGGYQAVSVQLIVEAVKSRLRSSKPGAKTRVCSTVAALVATNKHFAASLDSGPSNANVDPDFWIQSQEALLAIGQKSKPTDVFFALRGFAFQTDSRRLEQLSVGVIPQWFADMCRVCAELTRLFHRDHSTSALKRLYILNFGCPPPPEIGEYSGMMRSYGVAQRVMYGLEPDWHTWHIFNQHDCHILEGPTHLKLKVNRSDYPSVTGEVSREKDTYDSPETTLYGGGNPSRYRLISCLVNKTGSPTQGLFTWLPKPRIAGPTQGSTNQCLYLFENRYCFAPYDAAAPNGLPRLCGQDFYSSDWYPSVRREAEVLDGGDTLEKDEGNAKFGGQDLVFGAISTRMEEAMKWTQINDSEVRNRGDGFRDYWNLENNRDRALILAAHNPALVATMSDRLLADKEIMRLALGNTEADSRSKQTALAVAGRLLFQDEGIAELALPVHSDALRCVPRDNWTSKNMMAAAGAAGSALRYLLLELKWDDTEHVEIAHKALETDGSAILWLGQPGTFNYYQIMRRGGSTIVQKVGREDDTKLNGEEFFNDDVDPRVPEPIAQNYDFLQEWVQVEFKVNNPFQGLNRPGSAIMSQLAVTAVDSVLSRLELFEGYHRSFFARHLANIDEDTKLEIIVRAAVKHGSVLAAMYSAETKLLENAPKDVTHWYRVFPEETVQRRMINDFLICCQFCFKQEISTRITLRVLAKVGMHLYFVPRRVQTEEMHLAAVRSNGLALQFVIGSLHKKLASVQVKKAAFKENYMMSFLPEYAKARHTLYFSGSKDTIVGKSDFKILSAGLKRFLATDPSMPAIIRWVIFARSYIDLFDPWISYSYSGGLAPPARHLDLVTPILEALERDGLTIKDVPVKILTPPMILAAVRSNGMAIDLLLDKISGKRWDNPRAQWDSDLYSDSETDSETESETDSESESYSYMDMDEVACSHVVRNRVESSDSGDEEEEQFYEGNFHEPELDMSLDGGALDNGITVSALLDEDKEFVLSSSDEDLEPFDSEEETRHSYLAQRELQDMDKNYWPRGFVYRSKMWNITPFAIALTAVRNDGLSLLAAVKWLDKRPMSPHINYDVFHLERAAVINNGLALKDALAHLKGVFPVAAADRHAHVNGSLQEFNEWRLDQLEHLFLLAVKSNGMAFQYWNKLPALESRYPDAADFTIEKWYKFDRECVLAAVRNNGLALQYAGIYFPSDLDVVRAAVGSNGLALQHCGNDVLYTISMTFDEAGFPGVDLSDPLLHDNFGWQTHDRESLQGAIIGGESPDSTRRKVWDIFKVAVTDNGMALTLLPISSNVLYEVFFLRVLQILALAPVALKNDNRPMQHISKAVFGLLNYTSNPDFESLEESRMMESRMMEQGSRIGLTVSMRSSILAQSKQKLIGLIQEDGMRLQWASDFWTDNDIVTAAVQQNGLALQWAPLSQRRRKSVLEAAVRNNGLALKFVDGPEWEGGVNFNEVNGTDRPVPTLKTKDLVMRAVQNNGAALQHAGEYFKKDADVVQAAYNDRKWSIQYAKKSAIAKLNL